jgi:hypothetical protein
MELLIQNNEEFKTYSVDYHDGPRYPHLVREDGKADGLAEVLKTRTR